MTTLHSPAARRNYRLLWAAPLLLAACASVVTVRQTSGPNKLAEKDWDRTARVYLIVKTAPDGGSAARLPEPAQPAAPAIDALELKRAWSHAELWVLVHKTEKLVNGRWSRIVAAQTYSGDDLPAAAAPFQPTGALVLEPSSLRLHQEVTSEQVDPRTQKAMRKYGAGIEGMLAWRFYSEPGHVLLAQGRYPAQDAVLFTDEPAHKIKDLDAYLKDQLPRLFGDMLTPLHEDIFPHSVERWRTLQSEAGPLAEAAKLAKKGDWEGAAAIWESQSQSNAADWKAAYDLGIDDEHKGRWDDARKQYADALQRAPKDSGNVPQEALSELDKLMPKAAAAAVVAPPPMLTQRIAVLPFTNETQYFDAANSLRSKVCDTLTEAGYTVLPTAQTDAALKAKGGQPDMLLPAQLAAATSAELLLNGVAEKFEAVDISGNFTSRVALLLELNDTTGASVWRSEAATTAQSADDPNKAGRNFLETISGQTANPTGPDFLKDQALETVLRALGSLPQLPPPEKPAATAATVEH